jgi:hypothetical protein
LALAMVRDLRDHRAPVSGEDLADFETGVLAGFVLARASAGLADSTIRNDTGHLQLIRDWFGTSAWLLPGGQPGQPISAFQLTERLRQLGIRSGQSRSAAMFQLATDLPAAVLARLLGIHITVAAAWQRASAGDWAGYAAEVSRRAQKDDNQ